MKIFNEKNYGGSMDNQNNQTPEQIVENCFNDEVAYCCDHGDDVPCDSCIKLNLIKAIQTLRERCEWLQESLKIESELRKSDKIINCGAIAILKEAELDISDFCSFHHCDCRCGEYISKFLQSLKTK